MADNNNGYGIKKRRCLQRIFLIVFSLIAIYFIPLFPYMPDCSDRTTPTHVWSIFLSEKYRKEFVDGLIIHNVEYVGIGSVVFLKFRDWLDTEDWVTNVSNKSVWNLVDPDRDANESEIPEDVKRIVAESRTRHGGGIDDTCELVRAVAVEGW